ncbi:hypothetical protein BTVI_16251 [Pitangus sulphuratus]|nr:hypothetical protein BTVI_16251 [Pitangus sulphuratus]
MDNKQEELEAIVHQESYDVVAITETYWDDSHDWSAAMGGYEPFRRDRTKVMANKEWKNGTVVTEFILLDFGNGPELDCLLFLMFLSIYFVTITGNTCIAVLVVVNQHLHTPMFFFLGNLACLEICYSSSILPRMVLGYADGDRRISVRGCFT